MGTRSEKQRRSKNRYVRSVRSMHVQYQKYVLVWTNTGNVWFSLFLFPSILFRKLPLHIDENLHLNGMIQVDIKKTISSTVYLRVFSEYFDILQTFARRRPRPPDPYFKGKLNDGEHLTWLTIACKFKWCCRIMWLIMDLIMRVELNILLECFLTVYVGRLWICGFFADIIGKLHLISPKHTCCYLKMFKFLKRLNFSFSTSTLLNSQYTEQTDRQNKGSVRHWKHMSEFKNKNQNAGKKQIFDRKKYL